MYQGLIARVVIGQGAWNGETGARIGKNGLQPLLVYGSVPFPNPYLISSVQKLATGEVRRNHTGSVWSEEGRACGLNTI